MAADEVSPRAYAPILSSGTVSSNNNNNNNNNFINVSKL